MQNDVFDSLEDLGYSGPLLDEGQFAAAIGSTSVTSDFSKLIEWIITELAAVDKLEEHVHSIDSPDDTDSFLTELSGFLRECRCPYKCLTDGPVEQRLSSKENKLILLDYLLSELQAARISATSATQLNNDVVNVSMSDMGEMNAADLLKQMMISINIPKPPSDVTARLLIDRLTEKISDLISSSSVGLPLLKSTLSASQWEIIEYISHALRQDYEVRRQMVLQRLDVTIQSFTWSDRLAHQHDKVGSFYHPIRQKMSSAVKTDISHLLAARDDLLYVEKCSSEKTRERTSCSINRVVMGSVPDRGGRAYELGPPPPEMPSFQQRCGGAPGHRGGNQQRNRGGWSRGGRQRTGDDHWQAKRGKGRHY